MKLKMLLTMIMLAVLLAGSALAQFDNPKVGFGVTGAGAWGANSSGDQLVLLGRGYIQHRIFGIDNFLLGQFGGGYTKLKAVDYWAKVAFIDERILIVPYSSDYVNPFVFVGGGVAKPVYRTGTSYVGILSLGLGMQARIAENLYWVLDAAFYLALSDSVDGRARSNTNLNPITNSKQDGFYYAGIGLMAGVPSNSREARERRSVQRQERRARRQLEDDLELIGLGSSSEDLEGIALQDSLDFSSGFDTTAATTSNVNQPPANTFAQPINAGSGPWRILTFQFREFELSSENKAKLAEVEIAMIRNPALTFRIVGHTDAVGSEANNERVSLWRANKVREYLIGRGIESSRLFAEGRGEREPIADNTGVDAWKNRRVEFWAGQ